MKQNYREAKNDLIHCPFNPNHLVKRSRLITHKKLCPDKNFRGIVQCPYNPSHHVLIENLDKHKEKCPDRVVINSDLASEMEVPGKPHEERETRSERTIGEEEKGNAGRRAETQTEMEGEIKKEGQDEQEYIGIGELVKKYLQN